MADSKDIFHRRFEELYRKGNWTQAKFADTSKVAQSLIGKYLNRDSTPSLENLDKIAAVWGYSAAEFLSPEIAQAPRIERPNISDELREQTAKIAEQAAAAAIAEFQQKTADPLMVRISQFIAQKPENRQHLENFLESMAVSTEGLLEQENAVISSKKPKAQ